MYNHIRGIITYKTPSQAVIETNGVGYDFIIPLSTGSRLPAAGKEATLLVHMIVREDDMYLVGFAGEEERTLFRRLIALSGIGPAMALQILSGMPPQDFLAAVERQDAEAIRKIKGIGEKIAKRIILELKGSKTLLPSGDADLPPGAPAEAVAALITLGVPQNEAAARVERVVKNDPTLGVEDIIRKALR